MALAEADARVMAAPAAELVRRTSGHASLRAALHRGLEMLGDGCV